jgi:hypothetical protein
MEPIVKLHAPSRSWFVASLIIAVVAVFSALTAVPYISAQATWIAILGYIVLAVANLAQS